MIELLQHNLAQIIGFVALAIAVSSFQINHRAKLIITQSIANGVWAIHFFLLGAPTGSAMNGISIVRNYCFVKLKGRYPDFLLPSLFIGIYALAVGITWQGFISLLPLVGVIAVTVAFWQTSPRNIRMISLIASPAWFTYNLINSSYAGVIAEIFIFSSICIAILRYDILRKPESTVAGDTLKSSGQL